MADDLPQRPIAPLVADDAKAKNAKVAAAIAAAVAVAVPIATHFEGYRGKAYLDPAHVLTQCYGETKDVDPSVIYSKDQCAAKLRKRMAKDYAPLIIKCIPSFVDHHTAFGATLDAAYNAGPAAVCLSPAAKAFNRGDYRAGCKALVGWYTSAKNRKTGVRVTYPGLVSRRIYESNTCAKDAA